ncbi:MAG: GerAB/ArcD/ProY family transporter [Lachnospiraceae bacterium]|nr:GerAB/ArcD/ProY family transporter [Lachnospiraceae bacterium]
MFSDNQKISNRQLIRLLDYDALGISTLVLPTALTRILGKDAVFAIGLALLPAFFMIPMLQRAVKKLRQGGLPGWVRYPAGIFYSVEGCLLAAYGAYLLGDMITKNLLVEESFYLVVLFIFVLGGYGISHGIEGRARIYELLYWILLVPLILMLFLAARDVDVDLWTPIATHGIRELLQGTGMVFLFYMISAAAFFLTPYLRKPDCAGRCCRKSMVFAAGINAVVCLLLTGIFGERTLRTMDYPIITLMSMVKLPGGFLERQDVFMVAIWFFTLYAFVNTGMFFASDLPQKLWKRSKKGIWIGCALVLTFLFTVCIYRYAVCRTIFVSIQYGVVLPVSLLLLFILCIRRKKI